MSGNTLSEFGLVEPGKGLAYGVDSKRKESYSLRQARYHAMAYDVQQLAARCERDGSRLKLLDIGAKKGITKKYLSAWPNSKYIDLYGADLVERNLPKEDWTKFWVGDLLDGYPEIPSDTFDIVICEQVLEHLPRLETAMQTLERVLRPGGTLFVGVPIFPHGVHLLRKHLVPLIDKLNPSAPERGHLQAFSRLTFTKQLSALTNLQIDRTRGFRIVSGGILRPLENYRSWWRFNRWMGELVPGLCVEIQVVARKPERTTRP